jgi:hypothetical protein
MFVFCVQAQTFVARDEAGNSISLINKECKASQWMAKEWKAAVFIYEGKTYQACWRFLGNEVVILDSGGDVTIVPAGAFNKEQET